MDSIPELFNARALSRRYPFLLRFRIHAMKKAGMVFSHGSLTDADTVFEWMKSNPDFRTTHSYPGKPKARQQTKKTVVHPT